MSKVEYNPFGAEGNEVVQDGPGGKIMEIGHNPSGNMYLDRLKIYGAFVINEIYANHERLKKEMLERKDKYVKLDLWTLENRTANASQQIESGIMFAVKALFSATEKSRMGEEEKEDG